MSKLNLEQINKYLTKNNFTETFPITYGDFSINVKLALTELEKKAFINKVIGNSYINAVTYSPIDNSIAFKVAFAQMFTDLPVLTKKDEPDVVDTDMLCKTVDGLKLIDTAKKENAVCNNTLNELEICINKEIDFKNKKIIASYMSSTATDDAIETFSFAMNKVVDLLDAVMNQIEKNGDKLYKSLTPQKVDGLMNKMQEILVNSSIAKTGQLVNLQDVKQKNKNKGCD